MVLIVDDERVMREGCARICDSIGALPLTAENGGQAMEIMEKEDVDVLLLDLMMPGISGMELLGWVRSQGLDLEVLVITGYATVELAVEAMKKGANDFISKPFTPDQLRVVLRRAIDHRRLLKETQYLRELQQRSLADLAQEKGRLKAVINAMADGVVVCDAEGRVVLHNPPAERLLRASERGGLLDRSMVEVAPQELWEIVSQNLRDPQGTSRCIEVVLEEVGDLRFQSSPIYLPEVGLVGCVTLIQDISSIKEMERMKSDFVAMVSHELRSPLATVHQQLQVIQRELPQDAPQRPRSMVERAQRRIRGLLDLINDLLDLAKIEAGCMVSKREPTDLIPIIQRVVDQFRELASSKGLKLNFITPQGLPPVIGDEGALEEVFENLLSNAIAYTPRGGQVSISCGVKGAYVWAQVQDTGVGIPEEARERIFDRFYRLTTEKTRDVVGTGLGLPIVKAIVEAHMGWIEVESIVGEGSTFTVGLPLFQQDTYCQPPSVTHRTGA
jgi:PAS domain S-box-containing protein